MYGLGLKRTRQRRSDALTRVGWDRLESLLAMYYRDEGYTVDHCGTAATGKGTSRQRAEQEAARALLGKLDE